MIGYIITGVVCFIIGFTFSTNSGNNTNIEVGSETTPIKYKDGKEVKTNDIPPNDGSKCVCKHYPAECEWCHTQLMEDSC